jgi:hypothetical protein
MGENEQKEVIEKGVVIKELRFRSIPLTRHHLMLAAALIKPANPLSAVPVSGGYEGGAFFAGFLQGYDTLDALASLAFGIIVIRTIRQLNIMIRGLQAAVDGLETALDKFEEAGPPAPPWLCEEGGEDTV